MRSIFGLFVKSPFGALLEHSEKVHETVKELRPMVEHFVRGEFDGMRDIIRRVYKVEHQADVIRDRIRSTLPRNLLLPVDRTDLLQFLRDQDRIADRVEDVADLLDMRRTPTPESLRTEVMDLVDQVIRTSETWYAAAREITLLKEAAFGGAEAERILRMVDQVNHEEWEADKRESALLRTLFTYEDELDPVSVMVWVQIIQTVGRVADSAEATADQLRLMLARA
jgi:uncharacterized protein